MLNSFKKILKLLPEGDTKKLALLFGMMVVASLFQLLGVGTIPAFVAVVLDAEMVLNYPVIGPFLETINIRTPQRLVVFSAGLLIVIFFLKNSYLLFFEYINNKFMLNRSLLLKDRLLTAYMRSPYTLFIKRNTSELLRNVNSEVGRILDGTLKPTFQIALHSVMALTILTALLIIEPLITGIGMIFFGGFSFLFLKLTRSRMETYGSESLRHRNFTNKAVLQGLSGFKDARVLNREDHFLDEFHHHADRHRHYDLWKTVLNLAPTYGIELIALSGILFIAIVMVLQFRELNSIVTVLALFGAAIVKVKPSIITLISHINTLRYNVYSVDTVYNDLMNLESRQRELPDRKRAHMVTQLPLKHQIELEHLSFAYSDDSEPAVREISITIPKNRSVAFVGPSGAGKTTLVDVILGLLEPQKGSLTVDGKNVYNHVQKWQQNIGYIPQFIYLMDDTIRRNICFGIPDKQVDEEQLRTVIETSQLSELVAGLDKGVDTIVGERGVRLSGGQRQRIGIARALYNNPQVLVMDEATSALDNVTEKYVVKAIEQLRGEKTLIMIAHRLTTVQNCDTIYMMKEGEIIGKGTYDELLDNSKEFREMSLVDE